MKNQKTIANRALYQTYRYFKNAVSRHDVTMSIFYEHYFEAEWNMLYKLGIKKKPYPYKWFMSYEDRYLYK